MCEGWKTKYRFPDGRTAKPIEYSLCGNAHGDSPCKDLRVWRQSSQQVRGTSALVSATTSSDSRRPSNEMEEPRALQPYESAKDSMSPRTVDSSKPWKRRDSMGYEQKERKRPGMFSSLFGKNKSAQEEKKESRRRAKIPPRIVHVHHYPSAAAEAPEPPAAAEWLPSHAQFSHELETRPQQGSPKISTPPAYATSGRNSWNMNQPPPRLEERVPPSRRNSRHQPSNHISARLTQPVSRSEETSQALQDRTPRPYHGESRLLRRSNIDRSKYDRRQTSTSGPSGNYGGFEFPLREKTREEARRRTRDGNRDSEVFEDEPIVDQEKESLKEQLRVANAKLAEHEARNAAMANEAEVSRPRIPAGRSRNDSGHHSMYKPPSVQVDDEALDDDYLDYYIHDVERADDAPTSATGSPRQYPHSDHVRFEPQDSLLSPNETGTTRARPSNSYKARSRLSQDSQRSRPLDMRTAQPSASADHRDTPSSAMRDARPPLSGWEEGAARHKSSSSSPRTSVQPSRHHTSRYPATKPQYSLAPDTRLGPNCFESEATGQPVPSFAESPHDPQPRRQESTRSRRQNRASGQSLQSGSHAPPNEGIPERDATGRATEYIQQTKDRSHRVSMESNNMPSPSASSMMETSRGSSDLRTQNQTEKVKITKDDDPIEASPVLSPTVGHRDSKRGGGRHQRPSPAWV